MFAPFVFAAVLVAVTDATHTITLRNDCPHGVEPIVSNYPNLGAPYTGNAASNISAGQSSAVVVPDGWSGRICVNWPPTFGCDDNCFAASGKGPCSMTEWTFDSANIGGQTEYDISNIQGFSLGQQIIPGVSGDIVTCPVNDCLCTEAYRSAPSTCGENGTVPDATRVGASSDYTVV
ncbi:COP8 protein [Mycena sanguinolenta]|uniref:COP8 protein n=1 Tax=Mycena sanguinolenta TaxID=230812 RepID=A0A8H7CQQ6_9AGAR|nr:COP8 protein [Mycena sanguinolenta]